MGRRCHKSWMGVLNCWHVYTLQKHMPGFFCREKKPGENFLAGIFWGNYWTERSVTSLVQEEVQSDRREEQSD